MKSRAPSNRCKALVDLGRYLRIPASDAGIIAPALADMDASELGRLLLEHSFSEDDERSPMEVGAMWLKRWRPM